MNLFRQLYFWQPYKQTPTHKNYPCKHETWGGVEVGGGEDSYFVSSSIVCISSSKESRSQRKFCSLIYLVSVDWLALLGAFLLAGRGGGRKDKAPEFV